MAIDDDRLRTLPSLLLCLAGPLALTACDSADVDACATYIKGGLEAPSTFRQNAVGVMDGEPTTEAAFEKAVGYSRSSAAVRARGANDAETFGNTIRNEEMKLGDGHQVALRTVIIDYDASNAAGVPIRSKAACAFRLIDGKLEDGDALKRRAEHARSQATLIQAGALLGKRFGGLKPLGYPCCID